MAKFGDGVNYAISQAVTSDHTTDPGLISGKVRVMQDYITLSAGSTTLGLLKSTDYVIMGGKLPAGSQIIDTVLTVTGNMTSKHATLVVGDAGDADRYLVSNIYTMFTGNVSFHLNTAAGMYYTVTGGTDSYIRVTGANVASGISAGTIKLSVFYTEE